jgi:hemoglobin
MARIRHRMVTVVGATLVAAGCHGGGAAGAPAAPSARPLSPNAVPASSPADQRPAAPPAAGPPSTATLFSRLGGLDAIRAVVHEFHIRVGADERVNGFFRGVDMDNFERLMVEQVCSATGGGCTYTGRTMLAAHTGLGLTDAHFAAIVEDLTGALDRYNVGAREKNELLGALAGMKPDIVGH